MILKLGPPPCATATATIANIQESIQGLNLTCADASTFLSTVVIDVVGKLCICSTTTELKIVVSFTNN